jgi:predicted dehydrogenase
VIGSGPKAGEVFDVTMPSHVGALIRFAGGQSAQTIFSFDSALPRILLEVSGRDATLILPDPNEFGGDVGIRRRGESGTEIIARTASRSTRGTGVLDLARAIRQDRPHRADGALAYHVLDVMVAIGEAADSNAFVPIESTVTVAELLPADWDPLAATV